MLMSHNGDFSFDQSDETFTITQNISLSFL